MKRCRKKAVKWKGQDPREQMCLLSVTALSNPAKTTRSPRRWHILEGTPGEIIWGSWEAKGKWPKFSGYLQNWGPDRKASRVQTRPSLPASSSDARNLQILLYLLHTLAHLRSGCNQGKPFRWLCNFASSRKIIQKEMMKFEGGLKRIFPPNVSWSAKNVHTYTHISTTQKE